MSVTTGAGPQPLRHLNRGHDVRSGRRPGEEALLPRDAPRYVLRVLCFDRHDVVHESRALLAAFWRLIDQDYVAHEDEEIAGDPQTEEPLVRNDVPRSLRRIDDEPAGDIELRKDRGYLAEDAAFRCASSIGVAVISFPLQ